MLFHSETSRKSKLASQISQNDDTSALTLHHRTGTMRSIESCGKELHQRSSLVSSSQILVQPRDHLPDPAALCGPCGAESTTRIRARRDLFISRRVADYESLGASPSRQPSWNSMDCTTWQHYLQDLPSLKVFTGAIRQRTCLTLKHTLHAQCT